MHWSNLGILTKRFLKLYKDSLIFEQILVGCFTPIVNVSICECYLHFMQHLYFLYILSNICIFFKKAFWCLFLSHTCSLCLKLLAILREKWKMHAICYMLLPAWQFCQPWWFAVLYMFWFLKITCQTIFAFTTWYKIKNNCLKHTLVLKT